MCAGDITYVLSHYHSSSELNIHTSLRPLVFQWDAEKQSALAHMDVLHTCRDFEKLKGWAKDHKKTHNFDFTVKAEGAD